MWGGSAGASSAPVLSRAPSGYKRPSEKSRTLLTTKHSSELSFSPETGLSDYFVSKQDSPLSYRGHLGDVF